MPDQRLSSTPTSDRPRRGWTAILERAAAQWRLKATLSVTLGILFCVPYFLIGNFPLLPVHELPLTWPDRAIGFHPYFWVWVYQSLYVPVNLIPWLATERADLLRYARGFVLLSLISFAVFIFFPIRAPKPLVAHPTGMYGLLLRYDVPLNSLPSLHAGLLVYTLAFGRRITAGGKFGAIRALIGAWAGLILYATLATKEHYAVDIIAGAMLAVCVHAWVWREVAPTTKGRPEDRPERTTPEARLPAAEPLQARP
ncbi:MAG: hypothetical protein JWL69_4173 [Phycisphaerales bacterium]|nr:hypothetical protein [Phycisphaerales bacterium]